MGTMLQMQVSNGNGLKSIARRSAGNVMRSGVDAEAEVFAGEAAEELAALADEYFAHYRPGTPAERCQVDIAVRCDWRLRRLAVVEAHLWRDEVEAVLKGDGGSCSGEAYLKGYRAAAGVQRRIAETRRDLREALKELERLQTVPQPDPPPACEAGIPERVEENLDLPQIGFVPRCVTEVSPRSSRAGSAGCFRAIPGYYERLRSAAA